MYKQQFTVVGGRMGVLTGSINLILAGCLTTDIGEKLNELDIMC